MLKNTLAEIFFMSPKKAAIDNDSQFYYELTKFNIKRLHILSLLFLFVMPLSFVISFLTEHYTHTTVSFENYFVLYVVAMALNIYVFFKLHPKIIQVTSDILYYKRFENVVLIYTSLMLLLSMFISIFDYMHYGHSITYAFTLIILTSAFILNTPLILIPVTSTLFVFGFSFYVLNDDFEVIVYRLLFLTTLIPVTLVVSRIFYIFFVQQYISTKNLHEAHKKSEQLAMQLAIKNKELEHVALIDELTQVANRHGYHQYISQLAIEQKPVNVTAILIDIDYFKKYNDFYGHASGDEVLKKVANVLKAVCEQKESFVARWGGEEFLLLAKNKTTEDILKLYDVIIRKIDFCKIQHAKSEISDYLTLCVGAYQDELYTVDQLHHFIIEADSILYEVKESGRNGFKFVKEGHVISEKWNTITNT